MGKVILGIGFIMLFSNIAFAQTVIPAKSGVTYSTIGNITTGSDGSSSTTIGNITTRSDGSSCTTIGSIVACN